MKKNTSQGFTVIETLVAITILMISIAGPLTITHRGLLAAINAHDQVTASYLAQDAIEYLKNVRDNNVLARADDSTINWLRDLDQCAKENPCRVDTINGFPAQTGQASGIANCLNATCDLYRSLSDPSRGYSHDTTLSRSEFNRYFFLNTRADNLESQRQLVVVVKWTNGITGNEVTYENELFNIVK